jgi:hypothetical protein
MPRLRDPARFCGQATIGEPQAKCESAPRRYPLPRQRRLSIDRIS